MNKNQHNEIEQSLIDEAPDAMLEPSGRMDRRAIATPGSTKEIIRRYGLRLKRSLGQNFLTDRDILEKIVEAAHIDNDTGVLEIGPGIGALTQELGKKAKRVVALEIDDRLVSVLRTMFAGWEDIHILHQDVLKANMQQLFESFFSDVKQVSVAANLPYYITTPIIMKLLEARLPIEHIVVMIQQEVAERIAAPPGKKDYGSLSVAVQYYCHAETVMKVPRTAFIPIPNVDSAVLRLTMRKEPPVHLLDEEFFFEVVRASFAQRRKTLFNNLAARFFDKSTKDALKVLLNECGIDPTRRGETLSMDEFALISNRLFELNIKPL